MASGSIYQLLQSPDDQRAKRMQISALADEAQMRRMQLEQARMAADDERVTRELAPQAGGDLGRLSDLLTERGLYRPAQAIRQQVLAGQKTQAEIGNTEAQAAQRRAETLVKNLGIARDELARVGDEEGYQRWQRIAGALLPPQMMQGLPQAFDPAWRDRTITTADELLARTRPKNEVVNRGGSLEVINVNDPARLNQPMPVTLTPAQQVDAVNQPFQVGPNGQPVANAPVQNYQVGKAAAGATRVNVPVSLSTERKYGEQFAGKIADTDVGRLEAARGAPRLAERANTIVQILDSGNVATGLGANFKLQLGRALAAAGLGDDNFVQNTETLSTALAQNTLDSIKASGLGAGNGFSNADRDFLEKAVGGKIELNAGTIRRLAQLSHAAATESAKSWNTRVQQIPRSALEGTGLPTDPVQVPAFVGAKPGAPAASGPRVLSAQDREALQWARQNPNDPRAAQIRQKLGQ